MAFLVMQYLEGETLEQRLKNGACARARAAVAMQMADALATAIALGSSTEISSRATSC